MLLDKALAIATTIADNAATPIRPEIMLSVSILDTIFKAPAKTKTAIDTPTIAIDAFIKPFWNAPILFNKAIAPIKFANRNVIAPSAAVNLAGSIEAIIRIAAARIPIAPAIFKSVLAFKSF